MSTLSPRVIGGDKKETRYRGIKLVHLVPGGYKYGDLALQIRDVSNLRQ
jgi:hypothetical protein